MIEYRNGESTPVAFFTEGYWWGASRWPTGMDDTRALVWELGYRAASELLTPDPETAAWIGLRRLGA